MKRVLVTGMGIISAIGENLTENHASLRQGKTGIAQAAHFESRYAALLPFGECVSGNEHLKALLNLADSTGYTRTDLLASKAFAEAITDAKLSQEQISSFDTALISATTVGGMCLTDQLYEDANLKTSGSEYLEAYSCAAHTIKLLEKYKIRGFSDTINTACSSSANAILMGARLIRSGRAKRVIVGGVDSLAKYTVNGFNSLKILSPEACKPFDENRDGLNLGEAAAYLVLEGEEVVGDKKVYAEVAGYGNANDAHHPSAMSDEATGAIRSMQEAVASAGIGFDRIDYVNAHGTGTPNNDAVELFGMSQLFDTIPPFNSTKSYTGHTLGAAGAVEAIFSILSIVHNEIFASLHVKTPMSSHNARPVSAYTSDKKLSYALSNSFGFGGNCTSLVFLKQ
ncbi:beta-ketoacyl-[acyl-carrier-protein] synthase family protein [Dyadobacter fanqingshengii]|uniref:Beta-ketoacyl-[acyl-carrier-protein] synthase family protein n=1 Tax=Dyadobacter fanqingshengii TaxID=2906443 RepID=A0A9X1PDQ2_9BACT|nr:beta-ketoacyl-[acyl-carrier-protein] synthase family protein [Dyadobacter fanqingshengii]MCF0042610.1 beta-ketoacyl-[acyl-carrier-protein] synthase family protein [Dyadobacter fanqingshengii]USJ36165.1 beta-ketoacyl-[acyl-carrier-protein] synthase family protein [Dyadobacter fanqingshengii]